MRNHLDRYSMRGLCQALQVSRSGFYAWRSRPEKSSLLDHKIEQTHEQNKGLVGAPVMAQYIKISGFETSTRTVGRRMKKLGLKARFSKKFRVTTDSNHKLPIANNILNREFIADKPDQAWVTDITHIQTDEGWLYLAVMIDLFSRRVFGWQVSDRIDKHLVCSALAMALINRGFPKGVLVHSDRGSQYCAELFVQMIVHYKVHLSMSRKAICWDIQLRSGVKHLRVFGKGSKTRCLPQHPASADAINHYLAHAGHSPESKAALFKTLGRNMHGPDEKGLLKHGKPITADGIYHELKRYGLKVGISIEGFGAHALRATAATNALLHDADIAKVQELLGHANISMTRLYDRRMSRPEESAVFRV
jgi:putative transposase